MKLKLLSIFAIAAAALASCSTSKDNQVAQSDELTIVSTPYEGSLNGQWLINQIEMNDTISIRPVDVDSLDAQTVMFTDSTYHIQTNCNLMQGYYTRQNDSISFGMGLTTRMMCRDMRVEDALTQLLPQLTTLSLDNDSVLRISADSSSDYILLQKVQE